jgi:hypothetical protein
MNGCLDTTLAISGGDAGRLPPLNLIVLGLLLVAVLLIITVTLRGLAQSPTPGPAWKRFRFDRDQRGTASIEFALVLPFVMIIALMLTQVTLLMGSNLVVNYAAFAATRSAIVWIPADASGDEPPNTIVHSAGNTKFDTIRRAAVFGVLPVAGRATDGNVSPDAFVQGLQSHFSAYGQQPPGWVGNLMPDRLRYAADNTTIAVLTCRAVGDDLTFSELGQGQAYTFGPRDPVTVRVTHQLSLAVPYVRAFFSDGELDDGSRYTLVEAQYTLTNEGIVDQLPPQPELPRRP